MLIVQSLGSRFRVADNDSGFAEQTVQEECSCHQTQYVQHAVTYCLTAIKFYCK